MYIVGRKDIFDVTRRSGEKVKEERAQIFLIIVAGMLVWYMISMAKLNNEVAERKSSEGAIRMQAMEKMYGKVTKEISDKAEADAREYYNAYYDRLGKMKQMGDPNKITDRAKQDEYIMLRRGADGMATHFNLIMEDKEYYWGESVPAGLPEELPQLYGNNAN